MLVPNSSFYSKLGSFKKPVNFNVTDLSRMAPLPCGRACNGTNDSPPSWQKFIDILFKSVGVSDNQTSIQPNEPIMLFDTEYIDNLGSVLDSVSPR